MATAVADTVALTGLAPLDGLVQGGAWVFAGAPVLTYALAGSAADNRIWSPALAGALGRAFAAWASVANLRFEPVSADAGSTADIVASLASRLPQALDAVALAFFPDPDFADAFLAEAGASRVTDPAPEGDLYFDPFNAAFGSLGDGSLGFAVMLHEIGHALGLKHPDDDGANARPTFSELGIAALSTSSQTLMVASLGAVSGSANYPATPMPLDIAAIQHIYGANMATRTGDDHYVLALDGFGQTIWDAGGADTLDATAISAGVNLDLRPGAVMALPLQTVWAIAFGTTIENLHAGAGNDRLVGNDADNLLDGGSGVDTMAGGNGDDVYVVSDSADQVVEGPGQGVDTVRSTAHFVLPAQVERLQLVARGYNPVAGTGNSADNTLQGNLYGNMLSGLDGADTLWGAAGDDQLAGGNGDDMLRGDDGADQLSGGPGADDLAGGNGDDQLGAGQGHDTLQGNAGNDTLFGRLGNDVLRGGKGNDWLDGGDGSDFLTGGLGADHFAFTQALADGGPVDTVTDFQSGIDVIALSAAVFQVFAGQVGSIVSGVANLVYDNTHGTLAYDPDGNGPTASMVFAILGTVSHPSALPGDYLIVS